MTKKTLHIIFFALLAVISSGGNFFSGCKESPSTSTKPNQPPETHLWADTIGSVQTSQVTLHWWGDDPDGFVLGYLVTLDGINWKFTTSNDSAFVISIGNNTLDTAKIHVAAVDQEGNGSYDAMVTNNGVNYGAEAFDDADSSGTYSIGEKYYDYGAIDPSPARISFIVQNTPPVVAFDISSHIPSKTLPVATVLFTGTDVDGNSTIKEYFVSLNDTADTAWTKIPNTVSMLTLVGDLSDTSANVVPAALKSGIAAEELGISIKNLRLNQNNILYMYATDITGARSKIVRMPDTSKTWFVRKPVGRRTLLLVDDYGGPNPNPDGVYKTALQQSFNSQGVSYGDFDTLDIYGPPAPIASSIAPPMISETMKLYKFVFWYGKAANFQYAQKTIPLYTVNGGKVIFTSGFASDATYDPATMSFLPIDSIITSHYVPRVFGGSRIVPTDSLSSNPHPLLVNGPSSVLIFGTFALEPGSLDSVVYRLDNPRTTTNPPEPWVGTPAIGVMSQSKNLIFFSWPLHLMNTVDSSDNRPRLEKLFERIFKGDFGD